MKASWLVWVLLLLLPNATVLQLSAQQFNANTLLFEEVKAKAEKGDAAVQYQLGLCYYGGLGVSKDYVEAVKWWHKAADQDYASAQFKLGLCYYGGYGVARDYEAAVKWWRKSANAGNDEAQYNLGCCCYYGYGTSKDYVEADKWLKLASAQDNENANQLRPIVEKQMSPEQMTEAQQLVRGFKPSQPPEAKASGSGGDSAHSESAVSGTGFFITEDGFLVTNDHVVKHATQVSLITSKGRITASVVKTDAAHDLALLKAEGKFTPLPVATNGTVRLGSTVATVGFPNVRLQGFSPKLAKGEIAALSGIEDDSRYFQISVPVQPGNSGGALVDERGNVVGVVSAKLDANAALLTSGALPENVNYAVKSSCLLSFLESVPEVSAKLKTPNTNEEKFEDAVKAAEQATVLVLVR
jgi:S1-C subfamily serine protease